MDTDTHRLISALHNVPYQYVAAVTGGGAQALAMLFNVPGGSRTILETIVPYHQRALESFLGQEASQSCSTETSRLMAQAAYRRALALVPGQTVAGVGCTASLVSDRPKRGDHRFHLSIETSHGSTSWSLTLNKGSRDREGEEAILDTVLLNALAEVFGINERLAPALLPGECLQIENHANEPLLAKLMNGELPRLCIDIDGRFCEQTESPRLLLPGSFRPLHEGHLQMCEVAVRRTGLSSAFALGIDNVDKPSLVVEEIHRRVAQFRGRAPVWLSCAPTFVKMAPLFPGTVFALGYDTAERLMQPRYYENCHEKLCAALAEIRQLGCRFLVAGRFDQKRQQFLSLGDVLIPAEFGAMFEEIPESDFRVDVSSTEIRQRPIA